MSPPAGCGRCGSTARSGLPPIGTVPTVGEAGFPGAEANAWWGCYAPAKTPKEIIDRFRTALVDSLREDKAARMLTESQQMSLLLTPPEELRKFELEQTRIWGAVVRENSIKGD